MKLQCPVVAASDSCFICSWVQLQFLFRGWVSPGEAGEEPKQSEPAVPEPDPVVPEVPVTSTVPVVPDEQFRKLDHKLLYMLMQLQDTFETLQRPDSCEAAFKLMKGRLHQLTPDDVRAAKRQRVLRADAPLRMSWD